MLLASVVPAAVVPLLPTATKATQGEVVRKVVYIVTPALSAGCHLRPSSRSASPTSVGNDES